MPRNPAKLKKCIVKVTGAGIWNRFIQKALNTDPKFRKKVEWLIKKESRRRLYEFRTKLALMTPEFDAAFSSRLGAKSLNCKKVIL